MNLLKSDFTDWHIFRIISIIIAFIGLWLLLKSPNMGIDSADAFLRNIGGRMETSKYLIILESYVAAYRLTGVILLGTGCFCSIRR